MLTGAKQPPEVCREHQISDSVLSRWRRKVLEDGPRIFERVSYADQEETRIGQLTLALSAAEEASEWLGSPAVIRRQVVEMLREDHPGAAAV